MYQPNVAFTAVLLLNIPVLFEILWPAMKIPSEVHVAFCKASIRNLKGGTIRAVNV